MKPDKSILKKFASRLLAWNKVQNKREMPWKGEKDPYKIWLSEIILQQTRVEQGLKYYLRFIAAFPNVKTLANTEENKIYKLWEGLGYYTRCRNLIKSAKFIANEKDGEFPKTYDEIRKLNGIGHYTASAIASFAFNHAHAVIDGNVFRVLARIFGISKPIDSAEGKIYFSKLANEILDKKHPGLYNQAIMDFGAIVCKPAAPLCNICVFRNDCHAYQNNMINVLPVKQKKPAIKKRWFYYLVIEYGNSVAIQQRIEKDIWHNLFEYCLVETQSEQNHEFLMKKVEKDGILKKNGYQVISISKMYRQQLSHQLISGQFIKVRVNQRAGLNGNLVWSLKTDLDLYAFPRFINQYREEKKLEQSLV